MTTTKEQIECWQQQDNIEGRRRRITRFIIGIIYNIRGEQRRRRRTPTSTTTGTVRRITTTP